MKATLEIPDDLYAMVKARAALEGRTLRSVAIELFSEWARGEVVGSAKLEEAKPGYGDAAAATAGPKQAADKKKPYPWEIHGELLRRRMRRDAPIDEIAGVLKGPGPQLDMVKAREMYMQEIADEWRRKGL